MTPSEPPPAPRGAPKLDSVRRAFRTLSGPAAAHEVLRRKPTRGPDPSQIPLLPDRRRRPTA